VKTGTADAEVMCWRGVFHVPAAATENLQSSTLKKRVIEVVNYY